MKNKNRTKTEGPLLEALTHRLSQCPREFLYAPRVGNGGQVDVAAVVSDLIIDMSSHIRAAELYRVFRGATKGEAEWLQMVFEASGACRSCSWAARFEAQKTL